MKQTPITAKALIDAGYVRHDSPTTHRASSLFQKCVRGEKARRLYFINIYEYSYPGHLGWQPEVQFNGDCGPTFNITLIGYGTIEAVEEFIKTVYERLDCQPYDKEF